MIMLDSPADILRWYLIAETLGTDPEDKDAWPAYAYNEPDEPDNCITLYDTAARQDARLGTGEVEEHYGFQVRVRGTDELTARTKAEAIRQHLAEELENAEVAMDVATYTVHCAASINMLRLGWDSPATKRNLYTVNGVLAITRES